MVKLNDVERWSYTANDVLAVNRYYDPIHIGPDRGWRINAGEAMMDDHRVYQHERAQSKGQIHTSRLML